MKVAAKKRRLSSSLEDYIEAMYLLERTSRVARSRDIARFLGVKMSSVNAAMKGLADKGLIKHAPYSYASLTEKGRAVAAEIAGRHESLKTFLVKLLGVPRKSAGENACRMEHAVDPGVMKRIIRFLKFLEDCPLAMDGLIKGFRYYSSHNRLAKDCLRHIARCAVASEGGR